MSITKSKKKCFGWTLNSMNYNHLDSIRSPCCSVLVTVSTAAPWLRANWLWLSSEAPLLADVTAAPRPPCVVSDTHSHTTEVTYETWAPHLHCLFEVFNLRCVWHTVWQDYSRMMAGTNSQQHLFIFMPKVAQNSNQLFFFRLIKVTWKEGEKDRRGQLRSIRRHVYQGLSNEISVS